MNAAYRISDIDTLYRIPLITDGPWFFAPVQIGTPAQTFYLMLDTGSSLSWIQTTDCQATPQLCNQAPKFNISLSSTIIHEPEMISVRYTEGTIPTRLASDIVILGTASPPLPAATPDEIEMNTSTTPLIYNATSSRTSDYTKSTPTAIISISSTVIQPDQKAVPTVITERNSFRLSIGTNRSKETEGYVAESLKLQPHNRSESNFAARFRRHRTFGLTTDISGDPFLLDKETKVPGFLGASQKRFESDSEYSTHIFSEIIRELFIPVFSLVFTEDWGTLTLGGPDPSFYSKPLTWINTLPNEPGWVTQLSPQINIYPKGSDSQLAPEFETDYVITNLDRVWFDSGTTYIWGDERAIRPLNDWMGADPVTGQVNCSLIPLLGTIVFSIGGTRDQPLLRLELSPAEYIIGKSTSRKCFTALNISASKKDHWIFGLYVLRAFYTVYHYEYGLIGIAPYNITAINPTGEIYVPGIHTLLDQEVKESLKRMPSNSQKCLSNWFHLLLAIFFVSFIHCVF